MSSTTSGACKRRKKAAAEEEIHQIPKIDIFFKDCYRRKTVDGESGDKDESESENMDRTTTTLFTPDIPMFDSSLSVRLSPPIPYKHLHHKDNDSQVSYQTT